MASLRWSSSQSLARPDGPQVRETFNRTESARTRTASARHVLPPLRAVRPTRRAHHQSTAQPLTDQPLPATPPTILAASDENPARSSTLLAFRGSEVICCSTEEGRNSSSSFPTPPKWVAVELPRSIVLLGTQSWKIRC